MLLNKPLVATRTGEAPVLAAHAIHNIPSSIVSYGEWFTEKFLRGAKQP